MEKKTPWADTPLKPCGTYPAFRRHLRKGEDPCPPCSEARRIYLRDNRRPAHTAAVRRARDAALQVLAARHAEEFNRLYAVALKDGLAS